jgi:hypothetical protein
MTMKKLALIAIAAASIFSTSAAYAGWYDSWGYYNPSCRWVPYQEETHQAQVQKQDDDGKQTSTQETPQSGSYACY